MRDRRHVAEARKSRVNFIIGKEQPRPLFLVRRVECKGGVIGLCMRCGDFEGRDFVLQRNKVESVKKIGRLNRIDHRVYVYINDNE